MSYLLDRNIIFVRVTGECTTKNIIPMIKAMISEAERHDCLKWVVDATAAVLNYNTLDYYSRPNVYSDLSIKVAARGAVVFRQVGRQERFYENVCRNRGYNFCVFSDMDAAMSWLTTPAAEAAG